MNVSELAAGIQRPQPIQTSAAAAVQSARSFGVADKVTLTSRSTQEPSAIDTIRSPMTPNDGEPTDPDRGGPSPGDHGLSTISVYA